MLPDESLNPKALGQQEDVLSDNKGNDGRSKPLGYGIQINE